MQKGQHGVMRFCFSVTVSRRAAAFCTSWSKTTSSELQASSRNCLHVPMRHKEENWKTWKLEWQQADNRSPATSQAERSASVFNLPSSADKTSVKVETDGENLRTEDRTQMVFPLVGGGGQVRSSGWSVKMKLEFKHFYPNTFVIFLSFYDICF